MQVPVTREARLLCMPTDDHWERVHAFFAQPQLELTVNLIRTFRTRQGRARLRRSADEAAGFFTALGMPVKPVEIREDGVSAVFRFRLTGEASGEVMAWAWRMLQRIGKGQTELKTSIVSRNGPAGFDVCLRRGPRRKSAM